MPSLNFILPHWLYWGGLVVFPIVAAWLVARQARRGAPRGTSLFLAYLFWLTAGFLGIHRVYLRSTWALGFVALFAGVLVVNGHINDAREDFSRTHAAWEQVRAELAQGRADAAKLAAAEREATIANDALEHWRGIARGFALAIAAALLLDAVLIPGLVRRARERETRVFATHAEPVVAEGPPPEDPTLKVHLPLVAPIEWLNEKAGLFVAYWAVIAVFVYYYEVVARYVFNSPTNWVHESMFLMFGMQYMISGAYAYREDQHVRVDVLYAKLTPRGKALADIVTSLFFFIFVGTMLVTGWRFAWDATQVGEHSFTEWGVQYWPVKLMIPIGAALLLLQGLAKLAKDFAILARRGG
jgi:TRAP-type mannitol/chloroaromatic compound transport system permease small subunit